MQLPLFDGAAVTVERFDPCPTGATLRDESIDRVAAHNAAFLAQALEAIRATVQALPEFIVDDVWARMPADATATDNRAMGAAMVEAKRLGLIRATTRFRASAQAQCHANPRRIWGRR